MSKYKLQISNKGYRIKEKSTNKKTCYYKENFDIVLDMKNNHPEIFDLYCNNMLNSNKGLERCL